MSFFLPVPRYGTEIWHTKTRVQPLSLEEISFESAGIRLENDTPKYIHFIGLLKDVDSSFRIRWLYNVSSDSLYIIICDSAANAHLSLLATKLRLKSWLGGIKKTETVEEKNHARIWIALFWVSKQ